MYRLVRRALFLLSAERAHHFVLWLLGLAGRWTGLCQWYRARAPARPSLEVRCAGLTFPNPIGLAAGLDKNGQAISGLFALGFGALEVGTVTPRAQPGNPPPRLFRVTEHAALINRMGFNNLGADAMAERLGQATWRPGPLGVNIGKNKDTPIERAVEDYLLCVDRLAALADYVVVNASSPNTPGLRQLQEPEQLQALLTAVRERMRQVAPHTPLMLKISPDLGDQAIDAIVDVATRCGLDALIATNTTVERPFPHPLASEAGGLSGAPLKERSTAVIRRAFQRARGALPIIGVGGVFTAEDAYEKIRAGASVVQVYSGFVYEGPGLVPALLRGLAGLLERDGFAQVTEAVGVDARSESTPGRPSDGAAATSTAGVSSHPADDTPLVTSNLK
jgi:dihydroorotate dehydrogenase